MEFDYYYGSQADQFSFIRIPRMLLTEETFSSLTLQSKMLYSVLLDRMSLSMKNGWFDEKNRVYIIYQISEIQSDLGFSKRKAMDYLAELETFGLVQKKKRGFGLPSIIYVKSFLIQKDYSGSIETGTSVVKQLLSRSTDLRTSDTIKCTSRGSKIMNYDAVKESLQIRLCDTQENQERLSNLVHTEHSDFSATYHVNLQETILPSSCHEVIVVPEAVDIELKELSAMVQQINRTEVSREDRLSDHVQHYDRKEAVMENAEKRASRLEKEKAETKAAKKSIHERFGEKKQQSAAKKAEKAVEKAVKKDKGQEL